MTKLPHTSSKIGKFRILPRPGKPAKLIEKQSSRPMFWPVVPSQKYFKQRVMLLSEKSFNFMINTVPVVLYWIQCFNKSVMLSYCMTRNVNNIICIPILISVTKSPPSYLVNIIKWGEIWMIMVMTCHPNPTPQRYNNHNLTPNLPVVLSFSGGNQ